MSDRSLSGWERGCPWCGTLRGVASMTVLLLSAGTTSVALASDAPLARPQAGTMAQPLERELPPYPKGEAAKGQEGWVVLSYVVTEKGTVSDILVDESNGVRAFERSARRAVEKWRFEPATLGGKPTQQCHTRVLIPFAIDMHDSERGAHQGVRRRYRKATRALEDGDVEQARSMVAEIREAGGLNLYEEARLSILESLIAKAEGDVEAELEHLSWALLGKSEFIEEDVAQRAWVRVFALQVETHRYGRALDSYERMQRDLGEDAVPDSMKKTVEQIRNIARGEGHFSVAGRIPEPRTPEEEHGVWTHKMLRRTVGFSSQSLDALDEFDLRCDFHRAKGQPKPDRAVRVPEEWGACWLYVFGEPGTEFEVIEYGTDL